MVWLIMDYFTFCLFGYVIGIVLIIDIINMQQKSINTK